MALTPSTMLPLGTAAPDFSLPDTDGRTVSLGDFQEAKLVVVAFICNHCPFVKHVAPQIKALAEDYRPQGVQMVAIMPNDAENYPADSPEMMKQEKASRGYDFPYLYDATQEVARAYRAACTPDFYVLDGQRKIAYRGQLDNSRPNNGIPVTGRDIRAALDALLDGKAVTADQMPSMGCNIKWKAGNEPDYFRR